MVQEEYCDIIKSGTESKQIDRKGMERKERTDFRSDEGRITARYTIHTPHVHVNTNVHNYTHK